MEGILDDTSPPASDGMVIVTIHAELTDRDDARHGTVITLTDDDSALLLQAALWGLADRSCDRSKALYDRIDGVAPLEELAE